MSLHKTKRARQVGKPKSSSNQTKSTKKTKGCYDFNKF